MISRAPRYPVVRAVHRTRGITLLELMIVVLIVSLLAAIAYPNYREFAARAKRNEAKAALLQIATPVAANYITDSASYSVTVTAANASNFTATATYRLDGAEATKCSLFQLDGRGTRTSTPDTDCWTRTR
jgi:type IV pilus assembly protein PilE